MKTALLSCSLLVALLAGCADPQSPATSGTTSQAATTQAPTSAGAVATNSTYSIKITNFDGRSNPELTQDDEDFLPQVRNGTRFNFTMVVEGSLVLDSDHIGGHFDMAPSQDPPGGPYGLACDHVSDRVPKTFEVSCTLPEGHTGLHYLRGHVRITQASGQVNWWSEELRFRGI